MLQKLKLYKTNKKNLIKKQNKQKKCCHEQVIRWLTRRPYSYIGRIQLNNTPSESITLIMVMSQCKVMCAADGSYNLNLQKGTS